MSGKHHSQQVLVAMTNNCSPAAPPQQPTSMTMWHWTRNQMPLHNGKHSACPILGKGSKGGDDSIWFKKLANG